MFFLPEDGRFNEWTYITFGHWRPTLCLPGWKKNQEKLCEILPSLECEVCENATSLQKYRDCVGSKIMTYQNSKKQKEKEIEASYQLDETIENQKRMLG